jgi:hypothetical protein
MPNERAVRKIPIRLWRFDEMLALSDTAKQSAERPSAMRRTVTKLAVGISVKEGIVTFQTSVRNMIKGSCVV